jgi:hypothetical protein
MLGSPVRTALALVLAALLAPPIARSAELNPDVRERSLQLSALGDRLFRQARFEDAETAYSQALDLDPGNPRGHLGMGKIATLFSEQHRAAIHYSAAYQNAPRDPDAILAFANVVENATARQVLLRNFLELARDARVEDVRARLRIAEQLGTTPLAVLNSPYVPYSIPLLSVRSTGFVLRARVNGGRELSLILDTGATGIVLNASAGSQMDLHFLADAMLSGFGTTQPITARIARAASVEVAGLKISNLLFHVCATDLTRAADGMIGLDVFENFLIRLDPPAHKLELTPFAQSEATSREGTACRECLRFYRLGPLLLLRATVNGKAEGYFVLDSGSRCTMISNKLVSQGGRAGVFAGAHGRQDVTVPSTPVGIRLGERSLMDFEYATFDPAGISAQNGVEIAGAIGYSLLRDLTLTVDYRAGLLQLGSRESAVRTKPSTPIRPLVAESGLR